MVMDENNRTAYRRSRYTVVRSVMSTAATDEIERPFMSTIDSRAVANWASRAVH